MDTQEFLRLVLPKGGIKVLATPTTRNGYSSWTYSTYQSIQAMAEAALQMDAAGTQVYFAVHGYGDWYADPDTGKQRLRTQDNVVACRSLYDDFDVDPDNPKKYPDRSAALADVIRLARAVKLTPTITSSGGGYHCYFHLEEDVSPEAWLALSAIKRDITSHLGLKVDHAVDMDSARILRPIGTHNRKLETPRQVTLERAGKRYSVGALSTKLRDYVQENNVVPAATSAKAKTANPFAAALGDYPPSSALRVVEHCTALKQIADAKGDVVEPAWRAMLGLVKHCTEGEALCHEWSSGHPAYNAAETQAKLDNWSTGPTTCDQFDAHLGCKAECQHAAKIRSPIRLGYEEAAPSAETVPEVPPPPPGITVDKEHIPHWPTGYRWNGAMLSKSTVDADGVVQWIPFCRTLVYPVKRVRIEDGTWSLLLRARELNGDWREFQIATSDLASPDILAKSLGQYEVFLPNTKTAKWHMSDWFKDYAMGLQQHRIGVSTVEKFGWSDDMESFVIGTTQVTPDKEYTVLCGKNIEDRGRVDFGTSGTTEEWVNNIDTLLNRPGAEMMQFAVCHAFGAPLVEILASSNWHGLPMVLVGDSGHGKSTISKIACGIYGKPALFEAQASEDTINASLKRIAYMRNLPVILDEMSRIELKDMTRLAYAMANGRDRSRIDTKGGWATTSGTWNTNTFASSNTSIHGILGTGNDEYTINGTQLRFFEVEVPRNYLDTVFKGVTRSFVENHMDSVYGSVGRTYLRFLITHREWVRQQLLAAREKFNPKSQEESKERYYNDMVVTAYVAGLLAKKLGFIKWDMKAMRDWAFNHVLSLRDNRLANRVDPGDHLAEMISDLHGRMIITKDIRDGRSEADEQPLETLRSTPVGRIALNAKKIYVQSKAISDWCKEHGVPPTLMRKELDRTGILLHTAEGKPSKVMRIGTGTTVLSGPSACYEFNFNMLLGSGNGTQLRIVQKTKEAAQ